MYWTNLRALEEQIIINKISDHQIYPYFIAHALLGSVLLYVSDFHWPHSAVYVLFMGISFLGCKQLYGLAKRNGISPFFAVFWPLSWVVYVRLCLFCIPLFIVYLIVLGVLATILHYTSFAPPSSQWFCAAFNVLFLSSYFLLIRRSLLRIGKKINP